MNYNLNKIHNEIKQLIKLRLKNMNKNNIVTHNYIERRLNKIEKQINNINNILTASKFKRYIYIMIISICIYKYYKHFKKRDIVIEAKNITNYSINNTKSKFCELYQLTKDIIDSIIVNDNEE